VSRRLPGLLLGAALVVSCGRSPASPAAPPSLVDTVSGYADDAMGLVLRQPDKTLVPPPPGVIGARYVSCDDADAERENQRAQRAWADLGEVAPRYAYHALLVPGYTPLDQLEPLALHEIARARLDRAIADYHAGVAPFVIVSGGNVHPPATPFNEAREMKRYLISRNLPEERILIEPCARHSHTNLRNAARLMMSLGMQRALIVTSWDQAQYFGRPRTSSFDARCLADLGYLVGRLEQIDPERVAFEPSGQAFARGPDPLDP
jgi:hypothetical protein